MMTIGLNLLPEEKKERLLALLRFLFIKNILEIVIIICAIMAAALIWGWFLLAGEYQNLSVSASLVDRGFTSRNQDIRRANKVIRAVERSSQGYAPVLDKFLELADALPPGIKLNSLNLNREASNMSLVGTALNRQALLDFRETLKKFFWIASVEAPESLLEQKENINFELNAKIKDFAIFPAFK